MSKPMLALATAPSTDCGPLAPRLLRRGARQLVLLRAASAGLSHAPSVDERIGTLERAREALLQLEHAASIYQELTGGELLAQAEQLASALPLPDSWLEASVVQLMLCLVTRVELQAQPRLTRVNSAGLRALASETEHVHAARAALRELDAHGPALRATTQTLFDRWLPIALASLDDPALRPRYLQALETEIAPFGVRITH